MLLNGNIPYGCFVTEDLAIERAKSVARANPEKPVHIMESFRCMIAEKAPIHEVNFSYNTIDENMKTIDRAIENLEKQVIAFKNLFLIGS